MSLRAELKSPRLSAVRSSRRDTLVPPPLFPSLSRSGKLEPSQEPQSPFPGICPTKPQYSELALTREPLSKGRGPHCPTGGTAAQTRTPLAERVGGAELDGVGGGGPSALNIWRPPPRLMDNKKKEPVWGCLLQIGHQQTPLTLRSDSAVILNTFTFREVCIELYRDAN